MDEVLKVLKLIIENWKLISIVFFFFLFYNIPSDIL